MRRRSVALLLLLVVVPAAWARPPWAGRGGGPHGEAHAADRAVFHFLLDHRAQITRRVQEIPGGVETHTETDDEAVRAKLREHVRAMQARVEDGRPIHARDPLFAEVFRHADRITMQVTDTARGVHVVETSDDPYVAKLIRAHAHVVDGFLTNGHAEARRDHAPPPRD